MDDTSPRPDAGTPDPTATAYARIDGLFHAALELSPEERDAYLAQEAGDDPRGAATVRAMLAHHERAGTQLDAIIGQASASLATHGSGHDGDRFGPYRVIREISRGGMGVVYEAVRDDDYRKRVAIKVAHPWRGDPRLQERLRVERQILAGLEHPHIARLLDGGTQDGAPYVVMEYVDGLPITEYCDAHGSDLRTRLHLMARVCAAVQAAHERLVVHRDLKPSNIFVTEDGHPRLLDFGIAKMLDVTRQGDLGQTADVAWTPEYTSPEQVQGSPITVRTDVYALGLVLYELLCGTRAQAPLTPSPADIVNTVCQTTPPLPSVVCEARGDRSMARRLRGDLDAIVAKAIRKEPEHRYASAAALGDDLGRYLDGRPVLARQGSVGYHAARFLRRHRSVALAAGIVLVSLGVGVATTLYQAARAERRFQQVRTLARAFVFDVHDRIEQLPGATEARKALVTTALAYLETLRTDLGGDRGLTLELAESYEKLGNVQGNPLMPNLGDPAGGLASLTRAEELLTPLAAGGDLDARRRLASVLVRIAAIRRAAGDTKGSMALYVRARDLADGVVAAAPADRAALSTAGDVHQDYGRSAYELRDYAAADASGRRAMEMATRLLKIDPRNAEYLNNLGSAHNAVALTALAAGRLEDAAASFRASVETREQLVRDVPDNALYRRNLLVAHGLLADVLGYRIGQNLGDIAGAIAALQRVVTLAEAARAADSSDRRATFDLASAQLRLGSLLLDDGRPQDAERVLQEARGHTAALLREDPKSDRVGYVDAVIAARLGDAMAALARPADAEREYLRARVSALPFRNGPTGPTVRQHLALTTTKLAKLRARRDRREAALLVQEVADQLRAASLGGDVLEAIVYRHLGDACAELAQPANAVTAFEAAQTRWQRARLPAALEPRRARELTWLDARLAALRTSRARHE